MDTRATIRADGSGSDGGGIDVRLCDLSQLFRSLDPSPFRAGTLTADADAYFLNRVKEQPDGQPVRIILRLPAGTLARHPSFDIASALTGHFSACAAAEKKRLRESVQTWRQAALIGFATLSVCLFLAWQISHNLTARPMTRILQESFVILGWVSVWKPIETFLYELLPSRQHRRRNALLRLAAAEVVVREDG
ncbi:hypothetical protein [Azospirillum canadense]|uniref:hypothetical protein n=1 Tax=Azospirillum canadense TaxID=403962 RepID=UPI002225DF2F|nr:hypothetical protein [Azospirillum canadense]MCW2242726.1 hypothetical protein [Azospirillum canadense]